MAFKIINPLLKFLKPTVIKKDLEDGISAEANMDGSIYVDPSIKGSALKSAISHEMIHLDQMKDPNKGLAYDNHNVYWKGKVYPRDKMNEGAKNLPWEQEAYKKQ
jgi:hypothetical protein